MSNLNPEQFYHGTTNVIKDGMVRPAYDVDRNPSEYSMGDPGDMSEGDHAFVTKDENYAWHAAITYHPSRRRARVYETGPADDMKPGPWNKDHPDFLHHVEYGDPKEFPPHEHPEAYAEALKEHQPEYASKTGFPVRNRIDIMPGRQGTFPNLTWEPFKGERALRGNQLANHPSDDSVRYGMRGQDAVLKQAHAENARVDMERNPPSSAKRFRAVMNDEEPKPDPLRGQGKLF